MKTMIYVTKLISNNDNKEISVYISLEDFKKYTFIEKNSILIPYNDQELLDILNNSSGIMYEEKKDEEKTKKHKEKKKLTTKEKVQKTLAGLGIAVTIFTFEPQLVEGLSYVVKRINSISHCTMIEESTTDQDFIKNFEICINKNQDYKEEEKERIVEGFKKYINDWGYLLNEVDKEYILNMAENVNINRNVKMPKWASGDYSFGIINVVDQGKMNTITHETAHAFSDRGLLVGSINGYGLGYALNEGINTSVNDKYYLEEHVYGSQRLDALKLSLLVDNETLIKTYQTKGPSYLINTICKDNPNISSVDIVKYLSMMDIELFIDYYKVFENYDLPKDFYKAKKELYNKMFKAKYGYDYSESIMNNYELMDNNFLNDEFKLEEANGFKTKYYSIPKELLVKKSSTIDLQQYLTREFLDFKYSAPLMMLDPDVTMADYESVDEFYKAFAQKYSDDEKEIEKVKLVFTEKLSDKNFDYFMEYVTKTIIGMSKSPEHVACYFRELYKEVKREFKVDDIEEKFNNKMQDELVKYGMDKAIDLYLSSDIEFENYWIAEPDTATLPDKYNRIEKTENYVLTDSGYLVVKTQEDEGFWGAKYGEETIYLSEVSDDKDLEYYSELFAHSEGKYYSANLYSDFNIDTINESEIEVYVSHEVEIKKAENKKTNF